MHAKLYQHRKDPIKKRHNTDLKICVNCGNTEIQEYEFGISCELCGESFYFGKIESEEVDDNGTNM